MIRRITATVSLLVSLLLLSGLAVAAAPARALSRSAAIEVAQKEVARPTEVAATSHVTGSDRWTVSLRQEGARPEDRVYIAVDGSGRAVEWGWLDAGKLKPAAISKARALTLAKNFAGYGCHPLSAGLVLTPDTLTWEVTLARSGSRYQVTLDAFTGKLIGRNTPPADEEPVLLSRAAAVAIARAQVSYPAQVDAAALTTYRGKLVWQVKLSRSGLGIPNSDVFYIDAHTGSVLAHSGTENPAPVPLSQDRAVALAKEQLGVPAEVANARLDTAGGQGKWVVTLYEKEQPTRWHIFVLSAADGKVLQHLRVYIG